MESSTVLSYKTYIIIIINAPEYFQDKIAKNDTFVSILHKIAIFSTRTLAGYNFEKQHHITSS